MSTPVLLTLILVTFTYTEADLPGMTPQSVTGNTTVTMTEAMAISRYSTAIKTVLAITITIVSVLTVAGNILVIVAFATEKKLRSFGNYFILNLSLTDICVGFLIPIYAPYALLQHWPFGRRGCVAFNVIDYIVPLASSWNIGLISIDRCVSVTKPILYRTKQSTRWAAAFMSIPWIAGFLIFAPAIILWEYITGRVSVPEGECWVEYYDHIPYLLFGSTMEFLVPFVVVAVANLTLYLNLRARAQLLAKATGGARDDKKALARDRKTARSLAILVGVFFLTWAPYEVCALANPLCGFCVPDKVFEVTFWMLWVNSTINPLLYPFLQVRFREAFTRILTCGRVKVHPVQEGGETGTHTTGGATTVTK